MLASATAILSALAATACAHATPKGVSPRPAQGIPVTASCLAPRGSVRLTLTDTTPMPRATVSAGHYVVVTVPPWHWGTATRVHVADGSSLRQVCTVVLRNHGRRTVFVALRPGTSHLGATVEPASNLMMPAWGGMVVVAPAEG